MRNRVKRLIRQVIQEERDLLKQENDYIIIARKPAAEFFNRCYSVMTIKKTYFLVFYHLSPQMGDDIFQELKEALKNEGHNIFLTRTMMADSVFSGRQTTF